MSYAILEIMQYSQVRHRISQVYQRPYENFSICYSAQILVFTIISPSVTLISQVLRGSTARCVGWLVGWLVEMG